MKYLLTSAGIKNASIQDALDALIDLLGKPIAEANALCIPAPRSPSLAGKYDGRRRTMGGWDGGAVLRD